MHASCQTILTSGPRKGKVCGRRDPHDDILSDTAQILYRDGVSTYVYDDGSDGEEEDYSEDDTPESEEYVQAIFMATAPCNCTFGTPTEAQCPVHRANFLKKFPYQLATNISASKKP